jgi:hypothetical protein
LKKKGKKCKIGVAVQRLCVRAVLAVKECAAETKDRQATVKMEGFGQNGTRKGTNNYGIEQETGNRNEGYSAG